jgi:hypothetical protein
MKVTLISLILLSAITARAQSPVAVSTGADGALELTTPGIVVFDPRSFNPPLNPVIRLYVHRDVEWGRHKA